MKNNNSNPRNDHCEHQTDRSISSVPAHKDSGNFTMTSESWMQVASRAAQLSAQLREMENMGLAGASAVAGPLYAPYPYRASGGGLPGPAADHVHDEAGFSTSNMQPPDRRQTPPHMPPQPGRDVQYRGGWFTGETGTGFSGFAGFGGGSGDGGGGVGAKQLGRASPHGFKVNPSHEKTKNICRSCSP